MDVKEIIKFEANKSILAKFSEDYQKYFKWFLSLTEILHPTFQCLPLSLAIQSWLKKMGANYEHNQRGNIVIRLGAHGKPETTPTVAIQAHIDMVSNGEFKDGKIDVSLIKDPESNELRLVAEKSTLGADDGFGVALILELVERRNELIHGLLELILTVDEEMGLQGTKMLPSKDGTINSNTGISPLKYKYLINCDSLCGDNVYIGSAGGIVYQNDFIVHPVNFPSDSYSAISISVFDCVGGHSGQCIHLGSANAIKIVGRLLNSLYDSDIEFNLAALDGGKKVNIIPPLCSASILVKSENASKTIEVLKKWGQILKNEFTSTDPDMTFDVKQDLEASYKALPSDETKKIVSFIAICPSGVLRMSPFFPEIVDTSINLAVIRIADDRVKVELFSRSATKAEMTNVDQTVKYIFEMVGLKHEDNIWVAGVPWEPNVNSRLAKIMKEAFEESSGKKVGISLLHVTIEPPEFQELGYVDEDMISICPSLPMAHSIGEFIGVDEAIMWRNAVFKLLEKIDE